MFKFLILLLCSAPLIFPQYYFDPNPITLPDTTIYFESTGFPIPVNKDNVKSIGMGKTQVANGRTFNAMIDNPALLSRKRFQLDAISLQASLPPETFTAANYLNNNIEEFERALSLKAIWNGVSEFKAANNLDAQLTALHKIQEGLRFPVDLLENVIGSSENPKNHGVRLMPAVSLQVDNWGFSVWGAAQAGFVVQQSPIIEQVLAIDLPENMNDPQEVYNAVVSLEGILNTVINGDESKLVEVYPVILSVPYLDVVGAVGYGRQWAKNFSAGANLKVVHRRFSAKRIVASDVGEILNVLKRDLDGSVTGVTMDIGGLYNFGGGTEVGLTVQNIIPVQKITSTLTVDFNIPYYDYKRDAQGRIMLTQQGDTVVQSYNQPLTAGLPFDLELPIIVTAGVNHSFMDNWNVSLDLFDIAEQDFRFENYFERVRLGSEYRLDAVKDKLGVAFRLGLADSRPTFGLGFNIYRVLQIDGAYAYDNFVGENSYYAQIRLGW